ncbi:hypothetical protein PhCBS80983_g01350 [Powellomyces hirtus]|uniref:CUE domain-containing protein n=1 Tax=Powellomyces hirtus TaxID=109895 RepID=A0A507EBF6_9FUNG|nr:hypothetical protein PhCBS80983_g01350 [Powellomyces hirtus]
MEEIRAIFPDTEPEVCEAVLSANGGNVEAAINALLEMSNPSAQLQQNAIPDSNSPHIQDDEALARALAQQEQDEEFARRLEEEDRQSAQASRRVRSEGQGQSGMGGGTDNTATFRETRDKVVASASALGETAKKKFKEFYDKTFTPKESASNVPVSRQQYNNLPDDDFDSLLGSDAPDTPLERSRLQRNDSFGNGGSDAFSDGRPGRPH